MKLDSKMTVSALTMQHPSVMDFFIKRKMLCIGCPVQACHTLKEGAQIYGYSRESFLKILCKAIQIEGKL